MLSRRRKRTLALEVTRPGKTCITAAGGLPHLAKTKVHPSPPETAPRPQGPAQEPISQPQRTTKIHPKNPTAVKPSRRQQRHRRQSPTHISSPAGGNGNAKSGEQPLPKAATPIPKATSACPMHTAYLIYRSNLPWRTQR